MTAVGFCGLKPLLFRRHKTSAVEATKGTNVPKKSCKAHKERNREKIECSFVGADQLILMLEVQKKIVAFRDALDLAPCKSSASFREMVIKTLEDLQRLYPNVISKKEVSEIKGKPIDRGLAFFCESLKSIGESWMMNNVWMRRIELPLCKNTSNMKELGEVVVLILDCLIKLAMERFDAVDEDDQKKDFSPRASSFGKHVFVGSPSFSESNSPYSSSPVTPTSVLPELVKYGGKTGDSPKSCTSSLLWSLRVQAVGKLNPIDVKHLNFQVSQNVEIQFIKIEEEQEPSTNMEEEDDLVFDLDPTEELNINTGAHGEPTTSQAVTEVGSTSSPRPVETPLLPQQPQSPVSLPSYSPIPPPVSSPSPPTPSTPPPPPPPPPPPAPTPTLARPPPSKMQQNAVPLQPSVPMPPVLQPKVFPPLPPPSSTPQLQQNADAPVVLPPPPSSAPQLQKNADAPVVLPPPPSSAPQLQQQPPPAAAAAPLPPPPMAFKAGSAAAPPPPMPRGNGAAPPPPPPVGGRSLRPKTTTKLKRSTQLGNLYRSLKGKLEGSMLNGKSSSGRKQVAGPSTGGKQGMADALAEMTKRSSYFQQIEEDIQKYSKQIRELMPSIANFKNKEMTELVKFHKDVESVLEKLTDESQVLSRFEGFPTKKLEAIRMAAALYNKLNSMLIELQNWKTVPPLCELLDKVERYFNKIKTEVDALERTKDEESKKFKSHNIHFDFDILVNIKEAMVDVSSDCMELALKDRRENSSKSDGKSKGRSKMLWKTFQFAYRVYTFAGGHDDRADTLTKELAQEIENEHSTS